MIKFLPLVGGLFDQTIVEIESDDFKVGDYISLEHDGDECLYQLRADGFYYAELIPHSNDN